MKELGTDLDLRRGTRDAVHVPIVIGFAHHNYAQKLKPGQWVKFVDAKFTEFVPATREDGHGIIDPFLEEVDYYETTILLRPGITSPVVHDFEIKPELLTLQRAELETALKVAKENDPNCAGCWVIRNGRLIRN